MESSIMESVSKSQVEFTSACPEHSRGANSAACPELVERALAIKENQFPNHAELISFAIDYGIGSYIRKK